MSCSVCQSAEEAWLLPGATRPSRLRDWLFDELVPRDDAGNIALCRACQMGVLGERGFVPFLVRVVIALAAARGAHTQDGGLTNWARRYAAENPWIQQ